MSPIVLPPTRYSALRSRWAFATGASYQAAVQADSPVGYWKLDEAVGPTAADIGSGANSLTYINAPTLGVTPLITTGTSATLNGTTQAVRKLSALSAINANGQMTIEAWVKCSSAAAMQVVCSDDTSGTRFFQFFVSTGLVCYIGFDSGGGSHAHNGLLTMNNNARHQIAATFNGTTIAIYVDGGLDQQFADTFTLQGANSQLTIGERNSGGGDSNFYAGTVDEVSLYTTALSLARIQAHYTAGTT